LTRGFSCIKHVEVLRDLEVIFTIIMISKEVTETILAILKSLSCGNIKLHHSIKVR
jgi:hypothetical protein